MITRKFLQRQPSFERLESKDLLTILWVNQPNSVAQFNAAFGAANAENAIDVVERTIADWNSVLNSFNYAEDNDANPNNDLNDTFQLTVTAGDLGGGTRGRITFANTTYNVDGLPTAATLELDNDAGGAGWFFDTTPLDDIEFTSIADDFSASFIDVQSANQNRRDDLYRTAAHEIGHALGITSDPNAAIAGMFTNLVDNNGAPVRYLGLNNQPQLRRFQSTRANPTFNVTATFNGGHIYEGSDTYLLEGIPGVLADPVTVFQQGNPAPIAFQSHPNDLLNSGITVPGGVNNPENETVRQWISDLDAMILADAYGYTVTLPSTLDSAHVMLDDITGTLLVQGSARNGTTGVGVNDIITIERVIDAMGDDIRVTVDPVGAEIFVERVPYNRVRDIVVHRNGGADTVNINANVEQAVNEVDYVVSTNEDVLEDANSVGGASITNGIVDLSNIVPGTQTSLRAAIREANARNGDQAIYVGRGNYDLTLAGTSSDTQGDLDITSEVTIIGAGAGLAVIDATGLGDRIFDVQGSGSGHLDLAGVTLTGGTTVATPASNMHGGAIYVRAGSTLDLSEAVLRGNTATGNGQGGGLAFAPGSRGTINRSLLHDNTARYGGGLMVGAHFNNSAIDQVLIHHTIAANNDATANSGEDIFVDNFERLYSAGYNRIATTVRESSMQGQGFFEHPPTDVIGAPANLVLVTTPADRIDGTDNETSIREALQISETTAGVQTIWLPGFDFRLSRDGGGPQDGDLSIDADVNIVGAGAGVSVIDASAVEQRVIDIRNSADLDLSYVTLTGGNGLGDGMHGGAIRVGNGSDLQLSYSALVGNEAADVGASGGQGGGIAFQGNSTGNINHTVVTDNSARYGGGIILRPTNGTVTFDTTVFAKNSATSNGHDAYVGSSRVFASNGNNLFTTMPVMNGTGSVTLDPSDHIESFANPNDLIVVTSVEDTFAQHDNQRIRSVREAVAEANDLAGEQDVWLPGWDFLLTRERDYSVQASDTDVSFGDIDISDSIVIRGIAGETKIDWRPGIEIPNNHRDKIFDLLGSTADGTGDATASGADFLTWQREFGSGVGNPEYEEFLADLDDDGDVDSDDQGGVWQQYYGNTLDLEDIVVLS